MEKNNVSKGYKILLGAVILFTAYCLAMTIRGTILSDQTPALRLVTIFVGYALVIFYMVYGYKKPHGNLLRYIIFSFAVLLILSMTAEQMLKDPTDLPHGIGMIAEGLAPDGLPGMEAPLVKPVQTLATGLAAIIAAYISGRLNKFEKNKYLFTIVLVLLAVRAFVSVDNRSMMFSDMNEIVLWLDLNCAYMLRYNQHKEAGLSEEA